jgi:cell wall-associated NlpC family hydrolase
VRLTPGMIARVATHVLAIALVCGVVASPALAVPTSPRITAKQAEAAAAQKEADRLSTDLEIRAEEFNAVTEALEQTRADIGRTRIELDAANIKLTESQDRLAERASAIYKGGSIDMLAVLIGTTDFSDFLTRLDLLNRISSSDAQLVQDIGTYRDKVVASEASLTNREAEQVALRQEADQKRLQVEAALRRQQSYLAGLNAEVTRLMKEEQERQRKIAEERARQAAAEAAAHKASPREASGTPGASHDGAVEIALRYVGVPYVWGGSSPSGFDCSGLTHYVYLQLGIDLPRTSREQYRVGAFIAEDQLDALKPGDLVFFGSNGDPGQVHHVGMYVGSGNFLHAPGTGDHVKVSSLTERISTRNDYVGAVRP